jgi:hypothetical protein
LINLQVRHEVTHVFYKLVHAHINGRKVDKNRVGECGIGSDVAIFDVKRDTNDHGYAPESVLNLGAGNSRPWYYWRAQSFITYADPIDNDDRLSIKDRPTSGNPNDETAETSCRNEYRGPPPGGVRYRPRNRDSDQHRTYRKASEEKRPIVMDFNRAIAASCQR